MFRQAIARPVTTANRLAVGNRSFSLFAPRMTDDTGAPKSTGTQQSYVLFFSSYSLINTVSIFPISLQFSGYGYSVQRCKRRMTSCKSPHQQQSMLTGSLTVTPFLAVKPPRKTSTSTRRSEKSTFLSISLQSRLYDPGANYHSLGSSPSRRNSASSASTSMNWRSMCMLNLVFDIDIDRLLVIRCSWLIFQ